MKYCFVVNPNAGKGAGNVLIQKIHAYFKDTDYDYEVLCTDAESKGGALAKKAAQSGVSTRIYACGGDGSLFDVVNGCVGYENVEVGVIPIGTANDFVKTFGGADPFLSIDGQVKGSSMPIDLIRYDDKYSINICSMGMDAEVVNHTNRRRWLSRVCGTFNYTLSVFTAFIFNLKSHFTVFIDDEPPVSGDYIFVVAANGRFYGGGFNPTPFAIQNDGYMDVMLMNAVNRRTVIKLMSCYRRGEHLDIPGLCTTTLARKLRVESEKEVSVNLDGEVFHSKSAVFEVVPAAMKFILPSYVTAPDTEKAKGRNKYYIKRPAEACGDVK